MSRRPWAVLLSSCLVAFLFEGAVHSVHHLDSDSEATVCWVASAAAHSFSILSPGLLIIDGVPPATVGRTLDPVVSPPALRELAASRERAPPFALSA